jgi:hypothetical protein
MWHPPLRGSGGVLGGDVTGRRRPKAGGFGTGPLGRAVDARMVLLALLASQACGTRRSRGAAASWVGMSQVADGPRSAASCVGISQDAAGQRPAGATCFRAQRGSSASRTSRVHDSAPRSGGPVIHAAIRFGAAGGTGPSGRAVDASDGSASTACFASMWHPPLRGSGGVLGGNVTGRRRRQTGGVLYGNVTGRRRRQAGGVLCGNGTGRRRPKAGGCHVLPSAARKQC